MKEESDSFVAFLKLILSINSILVMIFASFFDYEIDFIVKKVNKN